RQDFWPTHRVRSIPENLSYFSRLQYAGLFDNIPQPFFFIQSLVRKICRLAVANQLGQGRRKNEGLIIEQAATVDIDINSVDATLRENAHSSGQHSHRL